MTFQGFQIEAVKSEFETGPQFIYAVFEDGQYLKTFKSIIAAKEWICRQLHIEVEAR